LPLDKTEKKNQGNAGRRRGGGTRHFCIFEYYLIGECDLKSQSPLNVNYTIRIQCGMHSIGQSTKIITDNRRFFVWQAYRPQFPHSTKQNM
jgi:hypothetical protein